MRWNKKIKKLPKLGDFKFKRKFLWFPKIIENQWRWLEFYTIKYEYKIVHRMVRKLGFFITSWNNEWVEVKRY